MAGPTWLDLALTAVMCTSAGYHAVRLRRGRRPGREREADVAHLAMGATMALMLVVGLGAGVSLLLATAFLPLACYFVARTGQALSARDLPAAGHALRQGAGGWAMVLMLVAGAGALAGTDAPSTVALGHHGGAAMPMTTGSGGAGYGPVLAATCVALAVVLAVCAGWQARELRRPSWRLGCQLARSGTMAYMLVVMA